MRELLLAPLRPSPIRGLRHGGDALARSLLEEGLDLSQACNASLITNDPKLGEHGGLIGLLSSGRLTREAYTVQALSTALFFASEAGRPWH